MIIAGGAVGYGSEVGDVLKGPGSTSAFTAVEEARALGKSLTRMIAKMKTAG